jgi:hypothetical protein
VSFLFNYRCADCERKIDVLVPRETVAQIRCAYPKCNGVMVRQLDRVRHARCVNSNDRIKKRRTKWLNTLKE